LISLIVIISIELKTILQDIYKFLQKVSAFNYKNFCINIFSGNLLKGLDQLSAKNKGRALSTALD